VRILIGTPEKGSRGGPAACEPPFIRELRRLGHEVDEEVYAYAESGSGYVSRAERVLQTAGRFRERVRSGNYDLVHINTSFDTKALLRDAVVVPRLHGADVKVFLKFHGSDAQLLATKNPALALARQCLLSHTDGIGVLSSEERSNFLRAGVQERKLFQIKNVVEPNTPKQNPEFFHHWNLPEDVPRLLFIGRFIPAKGLLDVIRACRLLRDRRQTFMLLCVGNGPARRDAEREVETLSLRDYVRFLGYIPEEQTADFYTNSTVLLFPTYHYEGFPMVIFRAAAAGLPIITTRIRAAADYLREPDNCLWVEPKKPDMLANKIVELLNNSPLSARIGANNKHLAAQFSAEVVTREYVRIYKALI
jgi:glycosyltransferase involved in cell wall biosynthesis